MERIIILFPPFEAPSFFKGMPVLSTENSFFHIINDYNESDNENREECIRRGINSALSHIDGNEVEICIAIHASDFNKDEGCITDNNLIPGRTIKVYSYHRDLDFIDEFIYSDNIDELYNALKIYYKIDR